MPVATTKDKGKIFYFGGGNLKFHEVTDTGAELTTPDTYHDLGYVDEIAVEFSQSGEQTPSDNTGNIIAYLDGVTMIKITGNAMQKSADLWNFITTLSSSKFYQIYHNISQTGQSDGKTLEFFGAIGKFKRQFTIKAKTLSTPFEITFLNNENAITLTTPNTNYGAVCTAASIAANSLATIMET